jgi:hypothetical protein
MLTWLIAMMIFHLVSKLAHKIKYPPKLNQPPNLAMLPHQIVPMQPKKGKNKHVNKAQPIPFPLKQPIICQHLNKSTFQYRIQVSLINLIHQCDLNN